MVGREVEGRIQVRLHLFVISVREREMRETVGSGSSEGPHPLWVSFEFIAKGPMTAERRAT